MPQAANNDLANIVGTLTVVILPTLGTLLTLFSQRKTIANFLRFLLRLFKMFNRVAQDAVEASDQLPPPTNGNGVIASQAMMMAYSEGSKRVDSVEDDVAELRSEVRKGFQNVDKAIEKFGEQMRIRADGDLLINSRKFEAVNKRVDDLEHDQREAEKRIADLEEWRGAQ